MPVIGNIPKARGRGVRKVELGSATGPGSDVSVGAGSVVEFSVAVSPTLRNVDSVKTVRVSGLPANILVSQVDFSPTSITFRAVNPTASAITIAANSLTVTFEAIGY
jgi:hypothetical protein